MKLIEEQGYLIPAFNTDTVDYVACAVRLAHSIRQFHSDASIALLTLSQCSDPVFNHVIALPNTNVEHCVNYQCHDWQVFYASPYRETIKLEADMIAASSIDHWWSMFRHRDVVISQGCRTLYDQPSSYRGDRRLFDANGLPDVYNAITYWRMSQTAKEFFDTVRSIFDNWQEFARLLKFPDAMASTDVVYAMAAQILGSEKVTLPPGYGPQIVHMKQGHQPMVGHDWTRELVWETDPMRVQTVAQWGMFHYVIKDWQP